MKALNRSLRMASHSNPETQTLLLNPWGPDDIHTSYATSEAAGGFFATSS